MHSSSRRGLASIALAALLVLAPLASTAAYADEEPVVGGTPSETLPETPAETPSEPIDEPVAETPAEPAAEVPAEPAAEAPAETPAETPAEEPPVPSASRLAPQYEYTFGPGDGEFPIYVGIADTTTTTATLSWDPTTYGEIPGNFYRVSVFDYTAGGFTLDEVFTGLLSLDVTLIHGHRYWVSFNDGSGSQDRASLIFTFPMLPAPHAATGLSATRLSDANGFALSWAAPADNTVNPVTSYQVEVSNGSNSQFYTTTAPEYTASGLETGTTYGFSVVAVSADGQRADGVSNGGNLIFAVAPTAPATAVLTHTGSALTASWAPPAYDGGAPISEYVLTLRAGGAPIEVQYSDGGSYTFTTEAEWDVEYSVSVSASNLSGLFGPATTSETDERVYRAPSRPITFASPLGYKDASVYVTWSAWWEDVPALESARLTVYNLDGSVVAEKTLDLPEDSFWIFDGLANNTDYTVSVILTNAAGSSTEGGHTPVRTFGTVPLAATEDEVLDTPNYTNVTATFSGSQITAHIDEVGEGEWVYGTAYSTPTGLGWTQVDANGFARWSVAGAGLATGAAHTLAIQNNFGFQLGFAAFAIPAVVPANASAAALAVTGTDSVSWMVLAAGLLGLGAVLMVRRRVRS